MIVATFHLGMQWGGMRTMASRKNYVRAAAVLVLALTGVPDAFAGRQVHGSDVARLLTGRAFQIECIDGTIGRGQVSTAGIANVHYRRASMSGPEESDHAVVRVRGVEICLAWKQFGGDGCYPGVRRGRRRALSAQHRAAVVRHQPQVDL
jgi:hypothetical protein